MRVLAVQENRMITFTWNAPPHLPQARAQRTFVTVRLQPEGASETRVRLTHVGWGEGGEWDKAHGVAQDVDDETGAWVHAYLHRKEGDLSNAAYWYRRAQRPVASDSLEEEWIRIVTAILPHSSEDRD